MNIIKWSRVSSSLQHTTKNKWEMFTINYINSWLNLILPRILNNQNCNLEFVVCFFAIKNTKI